MDLVPERLLHQGLRRRGQSRTRPALRGGERIRAGRWRLGVWKPDVRRSVPCSTFEEVSDAHTPRFRAVVWARGDAMRGLTVLTNQTFLRSLTLPALLVGCCLPRQKSGLAAGPGQPLAEASGADR